MLDRGDVEAESVAYHNLLCSKQFSSMFIAAKWYLKNKA